MITGGVRRECTWGAARKSVGVGMNNRDRERAAKRIWRLMSSEM